VARNVIRLPTCRSEEAAQRRLSAGMSPKGQAAKGGAAAHRQLSAVGPAAEMLQIIDGSLFTPAFYFANISASPSSRSSCVTSSRRPILFTRRTLSTVRI
jgi:hypothetical protein